VSGKRFCFSIPKVLDYVKVAGQARHDNALLGNEEIPARRPESEYNYGNAFKNHLSAKSFHFGLSFSVGVFFQTLFQKIPEFAFWANEY